MLFDETINVSNRRAKDETFEEFKQRLKYIQISIKNYLKGRYIAKDKKVMIKPNCHNGEGFHYGVFGECIKPFGEFKKGDKITINAGFSYPLSENLKYAILQAQERWHEFIDVDNVNIAECNCFCHEKVKTSENTFNEIENLQFKELFSEVKTIISDRKIKRKDFISQYPFHRTCILNTREIQSHTIGTLFWRYLEKSPIDQSSIVNIVKWEVLYNTSFIYSLYTE